MKITAIRVDLVKIVTFVLIMYAVCTKEISPLLAVILFLSICSFEIVFNKEGR